MKTKTLLVFLFFFTALFSFTQIIHVPGDEDDIQSGINAASDGDTVLVDDGLWLENIKFMGKAITVASHYITTGDSSHIYNTIIDGSDASDPDSASTVMFIHGEDTTSILCGFTITGGSGSKLSAPTSKHGGGICGRNSGGKIIHNIITENSILHNNNAIGGGISFVTSSGSNWVVIKDNLISYNQVEAITEVALGGGIFSSINAIISNNTIEYNISLSDSSEGNGAGVGFHSLFTQEGTLLLKNNIIRFNTSDGNFAHGVGVYVRFFTSTIIDNNINYNVSLADKYWGVGGLVTSPSGKTYILNNTFRENIGVIPANPGAGGGFTVRDPYEELVVVDGNYFVGNVAKHGGGFYSRRPFNTILSNNVFVGDSAELGGAIGLYQASKDEDGRVTSQQAIVPVIANNTFWGNKAQQTGGAIRITGGGGDGLLTFNNIFFENTAGYAGRDIYNNEASDYIWVYNSNIDSNNISGLWSGDTNFNSDPLFVPGDPVCHINGGPCHNTGIHEIEIGGIIYYAPDIDYDGNPRPQGGAWDVGADECLMIGIQHLSFQKGKFNLSASPNPTSGMVNIRYALEKTNQVTLGLLNMRGELINTFISEAQLSGEQSMILNLSSLPNGLYLVKLQVGNKTATTRIVVVR